MIQELNILGYRGFQIKQRLELAIPNGKPGSGLTVLVGPNGGGKSTVFEAFRKLAQANPVSFTSGKRNLQGGDRVEISLVWDGGSAVIASVTRGTSESTRKVSGTMPKIYPLASRRVFNPYFNRNKSDRESYVQNSGDPVMRVGAHGPFTSRLFGILETYGPFSELFDKVYGQTLDWTIDQQDDGQHYIKVRRSDGGIHTSDGLGEGVVSLLFIVEALFNSGDELVVIDEPELSLHPQLQRRLMGEILSFSATRQIVIATHSPELTSVESIVNGGRIARVADGKDGSRINQLSAVSRGMLADLTNDLHFPHAIGYDAVACLFAEDRLIITEGQEDVVLLV